MAPGKTIFLYLQFQGGHADEQTGSQGPNAFGLHLRAHLHLRPRPLCGSVDVVGHGKPRGLL